MTDVLDFNLTELERHSLICNMCKEKFIEESKEQRRCMQLRGKVVELTYVRIFFCPKDKEEYKEELTEFHRKHPYFSFYGFRLSEGETVEERISSTFPNWKITKKIVLKNCTVFYLKEL